MTNSLDALAQGNEDDYDEDDDDDDEDDSQEEDCSDDIDINGGGGESNGMANSNGNSSSKMTDLSKLLDPAYSAYFEVCLLSGGCFGTGLPPKCSTFSPCTLPSKWANEDVNCRGPI